MRDEYLDDGAPPDLVAEMRALVDETQRAIEASQAILDRCAERSCGGPDAPASDPDEEGATGLEQIADGLLHAYQFAKRDGDVLTVTLIEKALFHVGRRLARGMSVAEAGLSRH